jgi:hypothetical protein
MPKIIKAPNASRHGVVIITVRRTCQDLLKKPMIEAGASTIAENQMKSGIRSIIMFGSYL